MVYTNKQLVITYKAMIVKVKFKQIVYENERLKKISLLLLGRNQLNNSKFNGIINRYSAKDKQKK